MARPIFRFAPSPNGKLHLGHAYSAILCHDMARASDGMFLIRFEDIDQERCTPALADAMLEDLRWLGLSWDANPTFQSTRFPSYRAAADRLAATGLVYPSFSSRGQINAAIAARPGWPRDPDGSPLYPGLDRGLPQDETERRRLGGETAALRLDMRKALDALGGERVRTLAWTETGSGPSGETGGITADPAIWGDAVLLRKDTPASYHLAVVVDDVADGITHVVRGRDLFHATALHRLLQALLGLPAPVYHHHDLVLDEDGRKLSKSDGDTALSALRENGWTPQDVRRRIGL